MKEIIMALMMVGLSTKVSLAGWVGPVEVISGTWGPTDDQFGIERGDTIAYDAFAGPVYLLSNGDIIADDHIQNGRMKLYSGNGTLKKVVKCAEQGKDTNVWNAECNICGDYLQTQSDGTIWTYCNAWEKPGEPKEYRHYTPTGTLLTTSTTRPLELGVVTEKLLGLEADRKTRRYQVTIAYPDKTWTLITSTSMKGGAITPVRDTQGNLNVIFNESKKVRRYDTGGNILGELALPRDSYQDISRGPGVEPKTILYAQYRNPVVGPNGSIYCWMRSDTQYKILKWTWQ